MQVGDSLIKTLSGPSSFFLLCPKEDEFVKYYGAKSNKNVYLPIVMLFGDHHPKYEGFCSENSDEIYSTSFLHPFDKITTKDRPIDFNLEGYFSRQEYEDVISKKENIRVAEYENINEPIVKLVNKSRYCFLKNIKNSSNCLAPNLRWHHVDIRRSGIVYPIHNFEGLFSEFIIEEKYKNTDILFNEANKINYNKYMDMIELMIDDLYSDTDTFMNYYLNSPYFTNNSLIYKQINKQSPPLNNIELWKDWYTRYYHLLLRKYTIPETKYSTYKQFFNIYRENNKSKLNEFINNNLNQINYLRSIILNLICMFLDMYYVTRMFKIPVKNINENDINPVLSIGYFGRYHTMYIIQFLCDIMKTYYIKYSYDNFDYNPNTTLIFNGRIVLNVTAADYKCIQFPSFNLVNEINKYQQLKDGEIQPHKMEEEDFDKTCLQREKEKKTREKKEEFLKTISFLSRQGPPPTQELNLPFTPPDKQISNKRNTPNREIKNNPKKLELSPEDEDQQFIKQNEKNVKRQNEKEEGIRSPKPVISRKTTYSIKQSILPAKKK